MFAAEFVDFSWCSCVFIDGRMNGPVNHGDTKDGSFIVVGKTAVVPQCFVAVLNVLKSDFEPEPILHTVWDE